MNSSERLETQARVYFGLAKINSQLLQQQRYSILNIYSEDMITHPKQVLFQICRFLNLRCSTSYVSDCVSIISTEASNTRNNVVWTDQVKDDINASTYKYEFLHRYRGV